jgi:hypothetical protein
MGKALAIRGKRFRIPALRSLSLCGESAGSGPADGWLTSGLRIEWIFPLQSRKAGEVGVAGVELAVVFHGKCGKDAVLPNEKFLTMHRKKSNGK